MDVDDVRYSGYDWFDGWYELFVHARSSVFSLEEAESFKQTSMVDMKGGPAFRGCLVLNKSPDVDHEDLFLSSGTTLSGGQDFVTEFQEFFDRSLAQLRVTDSWRSALGMDSV